MMSSLINVGRRRSTIGPRCVGNFTEKEHSYAQSDPSKDIVKLDHSYAVSIHAQPQLPQILRQVRMLQRMVLMIIKCMLQPAVQTIPSPVAAQPGQRRNLSLTKDQILEAKEMFRTAKKVTRPEKAIILGFMAGSRFVVIKFLIYLTLNYQRQSLSSSLQH